MADDTEKLIVALEARMRDFERNFAKAGRTADKGFGQIERRAKQSGDKLESTMGAAANRMGMAMKAGLAGIFAGGVLGVGSQIAQIAGGIAQIGDEARRAGLSLKSFQELKYVAEQNRIGVDSLVDGIKELNLRADEFIVTGGGAAAEAFKRLGYDATTLREKLRDPSALFTEIIGKLKQLPVAARIRVMDEIFSGTGGEKFVALVDRGEKAIRDQIKAANDLGVVMDDELIQKADELDRKFKTITTTVASGLKQAIVSAAFALQDFIDRFREVENRQTDTLKTQLAEAERNLKAAQDGRDRTPFGDRIFGRQIETSQREVDRLRQVLRDRALESIRPQLETLDGGIATKGDRLGYTPPLPSDKGRGGASRNSAAEAAQREKQAVADLIAELEEELRLIGATDEQRRAAEASRMAGSAATEEQRQRIIALNEAIYQEGAALDAQNERMQSMANTAKDFISGFRQDLMNGVPPLEALGNAIGRLSDRIFDELLTALFEVQNVGSGGIGGIFGWLGRILGFGGGLGAGAAAPASLSLPKGSSTAARALDAINAGFSPAIANNGLSGGKPLASRAMGSTSNTSHNTFAPAISIKVEGGSRGEAADNEMAKHVAATVERALDVKMAEFMQDQMRPGNAMKSGRFG